MKANTHLFVLSLIFAISAQAQKEPQAKSLLDKCSAAISQDSGIQATFVIKSYSQQKLTGETEGTISLRGNCFILKTDATTTWFNGTTQWTYVETNEEINISNPTEEELQHINPYSFINLYKKGFNYKMSGNDTIVLTPEESKQDITQITLQIERQSCHPTTIRVKSRQGSEMLIKVSSYCGNQNLSQISFTLDVRKYPKAEIIDLR